MNGKEAAHDVITKLETAGFSAFIVGGAVRDYCMGVINRDIDVATSANVEDIQSIFTKTIDVGIKHGTLIVPIKGIPVEVSAFRGRTLEEDLAKRDFTINAMAIGRDGQLIDPFGGKDDIHKRRLKTIHNKETPFIEDPIRLLRAVRFALTLDLTIDDRTQTHINHHVNLIHNTAVERMASEIRKMYKPVMKREDWERLLSQRLIAELPFVFKVEQLTHVLRHYKESTLFNTPLAWWAYVLYHSSRDNTQRALNFYKGSKELSKNVLSIQESVNHYFQHGWEGWDLYQLGKERLHIAMSLLNDLTKGNFNPSFWKRNYLKLPIKNKQDMAIDGKVLLGHYPHLTGRELGNLLNQLERDIVAGVICNQAKQLLVRVEEVLSK
ncbi:CCA tRNA nucleotidyltransferase [Salipaludibacillus sp. LMS25]|jgi:tRNA nucleotidyltransferase (CCA-adding enzyme)|uniref:CCA tRNA nucleotidyltransferase n=1 Tax=Salipaludibacillus sp. LMS25 TaxID=2924031 RepID=UPI0020D1DD7B|nr:CCA tRNA nucleotidyltransferase [Salipaludibacillus sp. LMS25]UTR14658.1 CCA tRNA nucleotidyltransferase [Salipaludibacillus sp. LMS25]